MHPVLAAVMPWWAALLWGMCGGILLFIVQRYIARRGQD